MNFTDSKYGGYNNVYAGIHKTISVGAQADISANAGLNVFVAYNNAKEAINPQSWSG